MRKTDEYLRAFLYPSISFVLFGSSSTQYELGVTKSDLTRHSGQALVGVKKRLNKSGEGDIALLDNFVLKLFRRPPLTDAIQAVDVRTRRQNTKFPLRRWLFFIDDLHADAAGFVARPLYGKRMLHVFIMLRNALLKKKNLRMK